MKFLFDRRNLTAWLVLLVSVGITALVSWGLRLQIDAAAEKQFSLQTLSIVENIEARLRQHEQILLGGAGLFDASDNVSRGEWRTYFERLQLHRNYPGIQGVGFSQVIQPGKLTAHIATIRGEGFPEYTVRPPGERPLYTSIIFLEPFIGRNPAAFGFDMFSEATRNKAMSHAAATGQTAISGKVKLLQETHGKAQAGFLMYVPVYAKDSAVETVGTTAARWQALRGFVYSPYRVNDLMHGIRGEVNAVLDFRIHDGAAINADTLMYSSADEHDPDAPGQPRYTAQRRIAAYGHAWTIRLQSRPTFDAQFPFTLAWLVLLLGGGISVSLFALTTSLVNRRDKALDLANAMTKQIRESEQRFRDIIETSPTAARISLGRHVVFYNARYAELLNVAHDLATGVDPSTYYASRAVYDEVMTRLGRGERVLDRLVELNIPGAGTKWTLASYFSIEFEGKPAVLGWFHDISRQRFAEEEISRSRKLLADVLDAASISIIATDPAGLITIFNRGAERMLGYTATEMVGRQTPAIIHLPAEVVARGQELTQALGVPVAGFRAFVEIPERGGVEQREWTYVRKDGTRLPVTLAVTVVRDPAGAIIGYLGIAEDISERKRSAAELTRLSLVASQTINGVVIADANGVVEWVNDGFVRITGYTLEEMRGRKPGSVLQGPATDQQTISEIRTALAQGQSFHVEIINYTRAGKPYWIEVSCNPLRDAAGELQGFMAIETDITGRKQAEIALRDQAQHTQVILDNVVDGIIAIDERGTVASFNQAAEKIFLYGAAEVVGNNVRMLMPEPHRGNHDGYLMNYMTTGVARIIGSGREVEGLRKDGSLFPLDLSISEISHEGNRMFIGLVRDITERKRVERMKSEFVSTVSHELRTPLTSISGALGLLVGEALGPLPEQVKQMLGIAHKNSLRLSHLINDLLDMEKIAAGKMRFDMKAQAIVPLLEQAIESNRAYGEQHGVGFVITGKTEAMVLVDGQRLIQILSNFLSNAAKFSPAGASVELAASHQDGMLRVAVTDHGPGIPADFHDRIFQKFSQADSSDTRQKGGTGLGLAISRELAERMGGRVGFESTQGAGSTFFCDFPIQP